MNPREAVIDEIKNAPEPMVQEVYDFVRLVKSKEEVKSLTEHARVMPDFRARKQKLFGDRVLPDSKAILDEMRADRI